MPAPFFDPRTPPVRIGGPTLLLGLGLGAASGGGLDPLLASTHWRLAFPGFYGGYISIREIELAATPGGADLLNGGTAIQSAGWSSPATAFDNNTGTETSRAQRADPIYIGYTTPTPILPVQLRLTCGTTTVESPRVIAVQVSYDNGVTWRTVEIFIANGWTAVETRAFALPSVLLPAASRAYARVWRVNSSVKGNRAATGYAGLAELEMAATAGGADLCVEGTAHGGYMNSCFANNEGTPDLFNNTNGGANGFTSNVGAPFILGSAFAVPTEIAEFRLTAPNNGGEANFAPGDFTLEWSSDGFGFNNAGTFVNQTWSASQQRAYATSA